MNHSDNHLVDSLFRGELASSEQYRTGTEEEWKTLELLLNQTKPRKPNLIWLYPLASGIAALLLLFFGWQYLSEPATLKRQLAVAECRTAAALIKQPLKNSPIIISKTDGLAQSNKKTGVKVAKADTENSRDYGISAPLIQRDSFALAAAMPVNDFYMEIGMNLDSTDILANTIPDTLPVIHHAKSPLNNGTFRGTRLSLAILAAGDVNGVKSFKNAQAGNSFAIQLSIVLNKKLSITTGAGYAVKPYQTSFSNYKAANPNWWTMASGTANRPDNVSANCQVLDIPVNINYSLYHKGDNDFKIGLGLSSYFMLSENYQFNFPNASTAPVSLQINNQNQHYFGIININANYERKISSNLNLLLQPFVKLPISPIGFGQVNLKSTGIAVGVSWNFTAFKHN